MKDLQPDTTIPAYYLGDLCYVELGTLDGGWLWCTHPGRKKGKTERVKHWVTQLYTEPWGDEYAIPDAELIHHYSQVDAEGRPLYPEAVA